MLARNLNRRRVTVHPKSDYELFAEPKYGFEAEVLANMKSPQPATGETAVTGFTRLWKP